MLDNISISLSGMIDIITEYGIEIRKAGNNIEWKFRGETDEFWRLLMDATELNSQIIEMQRGETSLQWRIVGSDEWIDLITYDNLAYIGSQPIRDEFNSRLDIQGRTIQDNHSLPQPIDYMNGEPLCLRDGEFIEHKFLPMSPVAITKNTFVIDSNNLKLWPIRILQATSIQNLGFNVVTADDANIQIFLYSGDELNAIPTTKIFESDLLDCSTTGIKTHVLPFFIEAGYYFIGYQKSGLGTPELRSISDTSYNIISAFSNLEMAANTSAANIRKSCYEYDSVLEDLTAVEFSVSSSHRVIFATLRSNSESELSLESSGTLDFAETPIKAIYCEYDGYYYFLGTNFIKKSNDLITFTDLTYDPASFLYNFQDIAEIEGGALIIIDQRYIWLKLAGSDLFVRSVYISKAQYWETSPTYLVSDKQSSRFFVFYSLTSTRCNVYSFNGESISGGGTIGGWTSGSYGSSYYGALMLNNMWLITISNGSWIRYYRFSGMSEPTYVSGVDLSGLVTAMPLSIAVNKNTGNVYTYYRKETNTYCRFSTDNGLTWTTVPVTHTSDLSSLRHRHSLSLNENVNIYDYRTTSSDFYFNNSQISIAKDSLLITPGATGGLIAMIQIPPFDEARFIIINSNKNYFRYNIIQKE